VRFYYVINFVNQMAFDKKSLIYGRHPVIDAINSGTPFDKLILQNGVQREFEFSVKQLSKQFNIPLQIVPKERLNKIAGGNHQGIIGFLSLVTYYKLEDVLPAIYEKSETPLLLLLDGVTDVRNFGAIARSAEICGAQAIVIPKKGSAQINSESLKTSAGALSKLMVCKENSLASAIEFLQLSGVQVLASDLQATEMVYDLDLTLPIAIIIGSEGKGVSPAVLQKVRQRFIIPQKGTTDSFNVSVAAGIILYEVMRQRNMV
jgi:23S rRNA (guanosine2251-2'-O)-methyltransferase